MSKPETISGFNVDASTNCLKHIAGKGIANPIASILSFAMALRYSLDLDNEADALEKAVQEVLNDGLRTKDILSEGMKETSTSEMGDAIISKLQ